MPAHIDVIMPIKNAAETLAGCLESIVNQTYKNWQLIAIDDGSVDDSRAILHAFSNRINLLTIPSPGAGIVDALNAGIEQSDAPLIARMDADDVMEPERLEQQLQYLSDHPDIGATIRQSQPIRTILVLHRTIGVEDGSQHNIRRAILQG